MQQYDVCVHTYIMHMSYDMYTFCLWLDNTSVSPDIETDRDRDRETEIEIAPCV